MTIDELFASAKGTNPKIAEPEDYNRRHGWHRDQWGTIGAGEREKRYGSAGYYRGVPIIVRRQSAWHKHTIEFSPFFSVTVSSEEGLKLLESEAFEYVIGFPNIEWCTIAQWEQMKAAKH
jgi:hypothetical protein